MKRRITVTISICSLVACLAGPLRAQSSGWVYLNGNSAADNGGPFLGLGVTYMSALYWAKNDRNLLNSDLAYLASKDFNYIRILSEVPGGCGDYWDGRGIHPVNYTSSGGCFMPAWTDYTAQLQYLLDVTYDTYGMRTEITIFGGAGDSMPAKSTRIQHLDRVLNAIAGREHKVLMLEVANEGWQTGFEGSQGAADMREFAQYLAQRTDVLVAITSPWDTSNTGIYDLYAGSYADIATVHFSRDIGWEAGWYPVRDCWRTLSGVPPMSSNEPIGPGSSVASETDPIRLVMAAAFAWGANLPMYVYHTNAGVRRDQTFQSMAASGDYVYLNDLLPPDFVNWTRHDGKESASPFTNYANGQANRWWTEVSNPTSGAVRNTGKNNGAEFITLPIGILGGGLTVQARRPVSFTAYNPLDGAAEAGATLSTNGWFTFPQGPRGYIVRGVYPDLLSSVSVDLDNVDIERGVDHIVCCDGITVPWSVGGRVCRANADVPDHYMYFNVSDGFAYQGSKVNLTITIDYFDNSANWLMLQYDSTGGGAYKNGPVIQLTDTQTWKQAVLQINDAYFGNRQNGGSDFRVYYSGLDFYLDVVSVAVTTAQQSPYGGTPRAIPGTIEAEDFDEGGQGVAYNDADGGNNGGAYRSTDVDIEATSDTGGGHNVGWTAGGEWLEYTVNVANSGDHTFKLRVAGCCNDGTIHLEMNGQNISGAKTFAATGGWQDWTTILVPARYLTAGSNQILRVYMESGDLNLNKIDVSYGGADAVHVDLDTWVLEDGMTHPQVGDGDTQGASVGGHYCRRNVNPAEDYYFYFAVADAYAYQGSRPNLWVSFDYYDTGSGSLMLQYDSTGGGAYKIGPSVTLTNSNTWKSVAWNITDAYFGNRQNNGADFRIFRGTDQVFYLDTVQVSLAQP